MMEMENEAMNEKSLSGRKCVMLQICFLYCWLVNLVGTNLFYSVYALLGLAAAYILLSDSGSGRAVTRKESIWISIMAVCFSVTMILANYQLFGFSLNAAVSCRLGGSFLGGYIVGRTLLLWLLQKSSGGSQNRNSPAEVSPEKVFLGVACGAVLVHSLYLMTSAYPGEMSKDSILTIRQIMTGSYNNIMPFWHTITVQLFLKLGMLIFGDINAGVALFHFAQIVFMAVCFSYAAMTLHQAGVPMKYVAMLGLVYVLAPYNIVYSVTMWKDVLFGGALLLITTAFFRILRRIGKNQLANYILLAVGAIGFSVWRTNGWYALAVTVVLFFLVAKKKEKAICWLLLAVLILCWILLNPVLAILGGNEMDFVETLAVPFQQISRYIAFDGWMDEYEREFLAEAFDLEKVKELYDPYVVDPVKYYAFRRDNMEYIRENLRGYLGLYVQFGLRSPETYLEAWIEVTKGYWGGGFPDSMYELGVRDNPFGIVQSGGGNQISEIFTSYFNLFQWVLVFQPLCSIGLSVWVIIACCLVHILRKRNEFLLCIPHIVLAVGLWLGAPVVGEFRYGYPMILAAPFLLLGTIFPENPVDTIAE